MNESTVLELARGAAQIALILSLPLLLVSLVVGLVIGIIQAATQIHEQTVSFVPKILMLFLALALVGPWMLQNLVRYTAGLFTSLPSLAH
jgi:flagellar biosynthesis protein FliQ